MKLRDLCKQHGYDSILFEGFVKRSGFSFKGGIAGITVEDSEVDRIVAAYEKELVKQEEAAKQAALDAEQAKIEAAEEEKRKKKALSEMLITSGFNFDGFKITRYSGYISGDDCVTIPRDNFWGNNKVEQNLCGALVKIRRQAIKELKEAAYNLGCNAVIGVDFDYLTMDPQHAAALNAQVTVYEPYVICVTANGNAVVIEKDE